MEKNIIVNNEKKKITLVFFPVPAMGHMQSMIVLAKNIITRHKHQNPNHQLHIKILTIPPPMEQQQQQQPPSSMSSGLEDISFFQLPKIDPSLLNIQNPVSSVSNVITFLAPHVKTYLDQILRSSPIVGIVVDMFCVDLVDVAKEIGVSLYVYFASSASMLGFMLYLPILDAGLPIGKDMVELEEEEGFETIQVPGFSHGVPPIAIPEVFQRRKRQEHMWFITLTRRYSEVQGFIVNTFAELQPHSLKALMEGHYLPNKPTPPVFMAGPLLSLTPTQPPLSSQKHECIWWLDKQPPRSVIFLCFGSMGGFSQDQIKEIALGLDRSGHRFLWILRKPPPSELKGLLPSSRTNPEDVLPEGFLEKTKERGLVWTGFAPQVDILDHEATGGFMTHCGWNSCLESLWFGVPMLAWPLYAEQHLNAFEMGKDMGVAVELKVDRKAGNWVASGEVERGVRCLMEEGFCEEGKRVRDKAVEMREKGRSAVEIGGSSFESMERFVKLIVSNAVEG